MRSAGFAGTSQREACDYWRSRDRCPLPGRDLGWKDAVEMKAQMDKDVEDLFGPSKG